MAKPVIDDQKTKTRYAIDRRPDGTIAFNFVIPASDVESAREQIVDELVKQVEIPGFRKGAAPRNIAQEKLSPESIREEVLKKVLADEYVAAIKQSNITPVVNPRIHVEQFAEGTNLEFSAETCEAPEIDLKNYKEEVRKIKPAPKIIIPGKENEQNEGEKNRKLDEILATIIKVIETKIPKILIDQETDRLLSQLLDELKRLGISLDQYLKSRGKTAEELRKEYDERAEKDLKLEFILRKIADEEKITVEKTDIDKAIESIKDEKQKKDVAQNPYLVAAIIRQQKTLEFLTSL